NTKPAAPVQYSRASLRIEEPVPFVEELRENVPEDSVGRAERLKIPPEKRCTRMEADDRIVRFSSKVSLGRLCSSLGRAASRFPSTRRKEKPCKTNPPTSPTSSPSPTQPTRPQSGHRRSIGGAPPAGSRGTSADVARSCGGRTPHGFSPRDAYGPASATRN